MITVTVKENKMKIDEMERYAMQRDHYRTVHELKPTHPLTLRGLIQVCEILGYEDEANEYRRRYTSLRTDFTNGFLPGQTEPCGVEAIRNVMQPECDPDIPLGFVFDELSELDIDDCDIHLEVGMTMLNNGSIEVGMEYIAISGLINADCPGISESFAEIISYA